MHEGIFGQFRMWADAHMDNEEVIAPACSLIGTVGFGVRGSGAWVRVTLPFSRSLFSVTLPFRCHSFLLCLLTTRQKRVFGNGNATCRHVGLGFRV